jgi:hypothetical protein
MDDPMLDLMAGNDELARRLGAYGLARLTPDLSASSRMRARVLAVAHRQAALARSDGLAVLDGLSRDRPVSLVGTEHPPRHRGSLGIRRRLLAATLVATLAIVGLGGTVLAARAGGPLYGTRLWVEELELPSGSAERALAQLGRLHLRLDEASEAAGAGDGAGASAALSAYARIVDEASARALLAGDPVATAALEAGVSRDVAVLEALAQRLPSGGADAVSTALERAIERSGRALDSIDRSNGSGGNGQGGGTGRPASGQPGGGGSATQAPGQPKPDKTSPPQPTTKPDKTPDGVGAPTARPNDPLPQHSPHGNGGGG